MSKVVIMLRKQRKRNNGTYPIYLRTHINQVPISIATKYYATEAEWDEVKSKIKGNSKDVKDANLVIDRLAARVNDIIVRYKLMNIALTPDILKREFDNPSTYTSFADFVRKHIKVKVGVNASGTVAYHYTFVSKLERYQPNASFSEITTDFINGFIQSEKKNGISDNTLRKTLGTFRHYVRIAIRKKFIIDDPFASAVRVHASDPDMIYLTPEELNTAIDVYNMEKLTPSLQRTLRHYLFACMTGLRISDFKQASFEQIIGDYLVYVPVKTLYAKRKPIRIRLCPLSKQLIKDENGDRTTGPLFPSVMADQVVNRYLKNVAKECDIDKPLNFKSARHTFATIYLRETGRLHWLQQLLGHTNIRETMVYAHAIPGDVDASMAIFDKFK